MRIALLSVAFLTITSSSLVAAGESEGGLPALPAITLGSVQGSIGPLVIDDARALLFAAAPGNDSVEVIDLKHGGTVRSISGIAKPSGVLYIAGLHKLYVSSGSTIRVFEDMNWGAAGTIEVGAGAGHLRYDITAKRIYAGVSGGLAVIDPAAGAKVGALKLDGDPAGFEMETAGPRMFVNLPSKSAIAVVDRRKLQLTSTIPVTWAQQNLSMAFDEKGKRLLIGAGQPGKLLVLDTANLQWVTEVMLGDAVGDVLYDAATHQVFGLCGTARVPGFAGVVLSMAQKGPDHYKITQQTITGIQAKSAAYWPSGKQLIVGVPAAKDQPAAIRIFDAR